ncbi:flagellar protein FlaG [Janthinobacterium sp. 35]|jgi:flagellar protein FlaG|uniref:flagellar protein FlaG n=1 Tax=unclassified Janthinobacterium TaxID=2610881 RepID=UPI000C18A3C8|nr:MULTISPECIES: flagellar protein FlaG [unclassified Janthinobacterium]PIG29265.1 flagellar protein FlaG [Janthinobacterium sp. 35]PVX37875.1 flagellar protein FlaG [Janthinobacterium sp. 78]
MDIQATGGVPAALQQRTAVTSGTTTTAKPAAPAATDSKPTDKAASKEDAQSELREVKQAVSDINKAMQFMSRELEFSVDTDSERTVVKVIDQQTREVIRQMPTKEALEIGKALEKVQGLLIRQTA